MLCSLLHRETAKSVCLGRVGRCTSAALACGPRTLSCPGIARALCAVALAAADLLGLWPMGKDRRRFLELSKLISIGQGCLSAPQGT